MWCPIFCRKPPQPIETLPAEGGESWELESNLWCKIKNVAEIQACLSRLLRQTQRKSPSQPLKNGFSTHDKVNATEIHNYRPLREQHLWPSTCCLDALPTSFFKSIFSCLATDLLQLVNHVSYHYVISLMFGGALPSSLTEHLW